MLFNACGGPNGFHGLRGGSLSSSSVALMKLCETELVADFGATYHPLLKSSCNNCHSNAHGSNDVRLSFNAFRQKGQALIDYQATRPHGGNSINLSNEIAAVQQPWTAAMTKYNTCLSENPDEQANSGVPFNLSEKALTGITNSFREFSWDLYVDSGDRAGQVRATFRIEARLYNYQNAVVGFEFRNPSLQLAAGQTAVEIDGLRFTVAGQLQDAVTTYARISADVSGTSKTMLAEGLGTALVYRDGASAMTPLGFQFINLK